MKLTLNRHPSGLSCTIGDLLIDGELFCHTLEPPEKAHTLPADIQAVSKGFIPVGTYRVVITPSPEAVRGELWSPCGEHLLPLLLDVPGFDGIRIHAGNAGVETRGCVLVGSWLGGEFLSGSRDVLTSLMVKLIDAKDEGQSIDIEICAPVAP